MVHCVRTHGELRVRPQQALVEVSSVRTAPCECDGLGAQGRELAVVICAARLAPQWLFDGISRVIRNFRIHKVAKVDTSAERQADKEFQALVAHGRCGLVLSTPWARPRHGLVAPWS